MLQEGTNVIELKIFILSMGRMGRDLRALLFVNGDSIKEG